MNGVGVAGQLLAIAEEHVSLHLPPEVDQLYLQSFLARQRAAMLHAVEDLIERKLEVTDRCLHCGTSFDEVGDCGVDVLVGRRQGDVWAEWIPCCEDLRADVEQHGFEAVYGISFEDVVERVCGYEVLDVTEHGDSAVVGRLAIVNPTQPGAPDALGHRKASSPSGWQTEVFADVDRHHRHHQAPTGHKFSVAVHNGRVRVGVAVVGRPTARLLGGKSHVLEVTRLTTWGHSALRANAASKLYAAAARQAAQLGYHRIITYTLAEEDGGSLRAAGWVPTAISRGGSWDRAARRREDKAPTGPKVRWEFGLTTAIRRDVEARRLQQ